MGIHYNTKLATDGLVLCLDATNTKSNPGSGTVWKDISGNSNHCNWGVTPTYATGYYTFNGTSHYGTVTNGSTLNFSNGQTLIMILRHTYTSGRKNPWNQAYAGYGTWTHENGSTMSQYFGDGGGDNSPYIGTSSATTATSVWNVLCSTRDMTQQIWYLNGVSTLTTAHSYSSLTASTANITIGNGYAGYWQGDMAMVMAYTRALTATEVLQNFNTLRGRLSL